jgi:hypothetical protein
MVIVLNAHAYHVRVVKELAAMPLLHHVVLLHAMLHHPAQMEYVLLQHRTVLQTLACHKLHVTKELVNHVLPMLPHVVLNAASRCARLGLELLRLPLLLRSLFHRVMAVPLINFFQKKLH